MSMKIEAIRKDVCKKLMPFRIASILLTGILTLLSVASVYVSGKLLDAVSQSWDKVVSLGIIFLVITLLEFIINWTQNYFWFRSIYKGISMFRSQVFAHVMRHPLSFFVKSQSGDVINRMINDAATYAESAVISMPMLVTNILRLVIVWGFVLWLNWAIALLLLVFCLLYFLSYTYINKKLRIYSEKKQEQFSSLMDSATNYYNGIPTIKLFQRELAFVRRYRECVESWCAQAINLQKWQSFSLGVSGLVVSLMPLFVIMMGAYFIMQGEFTVGMVFSAVFCIGEFGEPIQNLTDYNLGRQSANASRGRIEELLCDEPGEDGKKIDSVESIRLNGLGFAYDSDAQILKDINLEAKKGDVVGIVGHSGGGKTTLLRILTGEIAPTEGDVLVNGTPLGGVSYASYLGRVAVVPQNIFVYEDSVENNVSFERELPTGRLRGIFDTLNMTGFLGRKVSELSGGEKRRVGLARALAGEFDVLILDEPTSDLDMKMEQKLIDYVADYVKKHNVIVFVVTHREGILSICNKQLQIGR